MRSLNAVRVTLVHNPKAGGPHAVSTLVARLHDIGWSVGHRIEYSTMNWRVARDTDVVLVAGGDGTVARVAKCLVGTDVPVAIAPMGTANNVARALGVDLDPELAIAALANAAESRLDLGRIRFDSQANEELFIEGVGVGAFAHVLGEMAQADQPRTSLRRAVDLIADALERHEPSWYQLEVDGHSFSGTYIVVALMNIQSLGPTLRLAPEARWNDEALDVVLLGPESRPTVLNRLRMDIGSTGITLPGLRVVRGRRIALRAEGRWLHADDRPWESHGELLVDVLGGALRVLLPRACA
jgi:diacylglycerol kinase (ATP)